MESSAICITGGARRIGRAIALHLAQQGYDIALHYNGSHEDAKRTKQEIEALGVQSVLLQADLLDNHAYESLIVRAKESLPHLNGLIHNASIFKEATFTDTTQTLFDEHMQLHVKAPFFLSQAYAKHIGKGAMVMLLDTYVTKHAHTYFTYLLSKKALADLTRMLAKELAPDIRVNAVAPGVTTLSDDITPEYLQQKRDTLPLKRLGQPQEIAEAVHYLMRAEYLTGHTLFIDGGEQVL